jgi:SAM-dependent methyltransferase
MDRADWLKQIRQETEEQYDSSWAPLDGEYFDGTYVDAVHCQFVQTFLGLLPPHSTILDAACGGGRYTPLLLEKGHMVIGIDQSQGMLTNARKKFPGVTFEKMGLQEMPYVGIFDGAICMDAMEHVSPEDWPLVFTKFQRALKPQGYLYFTVEMADENDIREAFMRAQQAGLPIVYGEWPDEKEFDPLHNTDKDVYHYYPPILQVKEWLQKAGFELLQEGEGGDYCYHHFIVRKAP